MHPHPLDPHPNVQTVPLTGRVTVAYGPVTGERWQANATIVVGDRVTAVVDAMMTPRQTVPVEAAARAAANDRRVGLVALTHADPDHVLGRDTFAGAVVVASDASAAILRDPAVQASYASLSRDLATRDGWQASRSRCHGWTWRSGTRCTWIWAA